jgi:diguanylate cyclase (GGDEF)-like protein
MDELTKVLFKAHENPDYIFGVLLMDLDKFKLINDNLGHLIGDKLLFEMGQRLEFCLRTNDILARIGGDEFGIIINNIRQAGDATHLSARIKSEMSKPFVVDNKEIFLSSCMGIVFNNESHNSIESMVQDANTVLAQAKRKGQGCIEVFSQSMRERELVTYKIESGLRQALDRGELFLVYQPIFNLKTRKLEAFEALVRWHNPELGFIRPTEFIPVAEESGLILSIGEWILRTACAQMKSWEEMGFTDLVISVNVAAPQFTHQDVPNLTKRVLRDTGLDPKNLKLEITESVAMKDVSKTIETLEHLNQMGLGISIDDFGTGYSSLSYLKQYPIHTLKIDRSFVMDIPHDPDNMSITSTIIAMAKNLNLSIIAEGVENEDQIAFLEEHNCDQVQGFYFSKPLNTEDTLALLQEEFFRE